jgi:hypothetical protein
MLSCAYLFAECLRIIPLSIRTHYHSDRLIDTWRLRTVEFCRHDWWFCPILLSGANDVPRANTKPSRN